MWPPEVPRRHVVRAGGLVGGVEIVEAEAHPAEPDLGGEAAGGARADAAVSPSFQATRRHGGAAAARQKRAGRERWRGTERWQDTERWEGVGFYKARWKPPAKTSACPVAFSRARDPFPTSLLSLLSSLLLYLFYI